MAYAVFGFNSVECLNLPFFMQAIVLTPRDGLQNLGLCLKEDFSVGLGCSKRMFNPFSYVMVRKKPYF